MLNLIAKLGQSIINIIAMLGRSGLMLFGALIGKPQFSKQFPLLVKQFYFVGVQSLSIIIVSGLFIGMVLALQGYFI